MMFEKVGYFLIKYSQLPLWRTPPGFSTRAVSRQKSLAISHELAAYLSLEITPPKAKI